VGQGRQVSPVISLGLLEKDKGNSSKAIDLYQQTLELHPDYADAHYNLANILQIFGATKSAENHYRKAIECNPNHVAAMHGLGQLLSSQGEIDSALELLENARRLQPTSQDISAAIADIYEKLGNHEMALAVLEPLLKSQLISPGVSLSYAKSAPYFNKHEDAIKILKRQLINSALPSQIKAEIHFSLGNLLDSIDDFEEAFENFKLGNATRTSTTDEASFIQLRGIQKQFTCDKHEQASRSNVPSSKPVFIVGMPRSGTTLVEQIVSSHPLISGAGELSYIGDILNSFPERFGSSRNYPTCMDELSVADLNTLAQEYLKNLSKHAPDATRITDKMPHNFLHLGLIDRLFPNSRIIHCVRSPMDTCLSIYFHNFSGNHPYTNNLRALGEYYKGYIELMNHWKRIIRIPLMEVVYEDLVENQEAVSRNMISFCEVDWDQQCLRFNESERIVNTPSYDQVRQPIYTKSINRWKNYEKHLEPLITALK